MKFLMGDQVHVSYNGTRSSLIGQVVGVQERDDGLYYTVCLTFDSKPRTLSMVLSEDQLELTPAAKFSHDIDSL